MDEARQICPHCFVMLSAELIVYPLLLPKQGRHKRAGVQCGSAGSNPGSQNACLNAHC
jgi:hypothetical protein